MSERRHVRAILHRDRDGEGTGIAVPFQVLDVFGTRGRVPFRGCREAGVRAGDEVDARVEREPATQAALPADLRRALRARPGAGPRWRGLAHIRQVKHVRGILDAKATRARFIPRALEAHPGRGPRGKGRP